MLRTDFVKTIAPYIQKYAKDYKIPFASPIIAQAVIESNYGQSKLSANYHNYFGLKCGSSWKGKSVNMKTKEEYTKGNLTTIKDNFRVYPDMDEGVKGYFDFISTKRYANLKKAASPYQYCQLLKQDGYATSSSYVSTLYNTIVKLNLMAYDDAIIPIETTVSTTSKKSVSQIATEVIAGKWGNGRTRKKKLEDAGYDYKEVQATVNKLLRNL